MPEIRVRPGTVFEHHVCTKKENVRIQWSFSTRNRKICFGLFYKATEGGSTRASFVAERDGQQQSYSDDEGRRNSTSVKDSSSSVYSRSKKKKASAIHFLDNDFIELVPIEPIERSKVPTVGSFDALEPGNYVLVFDNMFSMHKSKMLTLDVSTNEEQQDEEEEEEEEEEEDEAVALLDHDMSGWLLKKRRKKMQGWAKRWFELTPDGVLSYSFRKDSVKRGSIQTLFATVSVSPKQRIIHLDSGTTTFHLRALSTEQFDQWLEGIRGKRAKKVVWEEHDDGTRSAISLSSEIDHNQVIVKALNDLDVELKSLSTLLVSNNQEPVVASSSSASMVSTPPPPLLHHSSGSSIKLRFPFKRGASYSSTLDAYHQSPSTVVVLEKVSRSIKLMTDYREKLANAYDQSVNTLLDVPGSRTGTGLMSHRSVSSFYSYGGISDTFFDAEDFSISGEEDVVAGDSEDEDSSHGEENVSKDLISRRTRLPHTVAVKKLSIISLLRKFIGKDLSSIPLPIMLNEPLNLLQRLCEELEYSELLDHAATQASSMDRLMYVTAFAVSGYASTHYRLGRKPFNPLLGETYECVRTDKGFTFISEKVSHVPNTMACHASSRNFEFRQSFAGDIKFWGQSMDLYTKGQGHVTLTGHQDQFTYTKPMSSSKNLVTGTKYIEHVGEMRVNNHETGEYAIVNFKESKSGSGFFSSGGGNIMDRNKIEAKFFDCRGSLIKEVEGKWNDTLSEVSGPDQYTVIWRAKAPDVQEPQEYYGFTQFAMELNEITALEESKLPATDTRYRKDQRLFEDGFVSEAEVEKTRVEQFQRERRAQGESAVPMWFEMKEDKYHPDGESWQYKGGYWEARSSGQWPQAVNLW